MALLLVAVSVFAAAAEPDLKVKTCRQDVPTTTAPSPDWEGRPMPAEIKARLVPVKLKRFATPAGQNPTFSGRITGISAADQPEVGVVSLIGVHWLRNDNYEWKAVNPDCTFSVAAEKSPNVQHALCVKATGHPWTFLRAEFAPNESASDIEFNVPEPKTVRITAETSDGQPVPSFKIEIFNAYQTTDDNARPLHRQRMGYVLASGGELVTDLAEPVGLLLSGGGAAPAYEVIDPAEADEFHFILLREAILTGIVLRNGMPAVGERLMIANEAAPLSATAKRTDNAGRFTASGRTPGTTTIYVAGKDRLVVNLAEGEHRDVKIVLDDPSTSKPSN